MVAPSLGIAAWGLVTGVAMVKSGLSVPAAVAMSIFVNAGSAQLAALPLLVAGAPLWVLWATAFCVNLRFVIYSAHWRGYLGHLPRWQRIASTYLSGDLTYVLFVQRFPELERQPEQLPYFWGSVVWGWASWQAASLLGIGIAERVPTQWGLGFAGVLALLGITYSQLADRKVRITAAISACAAVAAFAMPLKLNILVAIAAGVASGLLLDRTSPESVREGA